MLLAPCRPPSTARHHNCSLHPLPAAPSTALASLQIAAGLFQSTGWPSVVSIMANWYGKGKRGLIMGIWNAHTSLGNILGSFTAAAALSYGWGWSFLLPAIGMAVIGVLVWLFLVIQPSDVGLPSPYEPLREESEVRRSTG